MKLATILTSRGKQAAAVLGERVIDLSGAGFSDVLSVLQAGSEERAKLENWLYHPPAEAEIALSAATLLAPIPRPPKLICIGLNYREHAVESKMEIPKTPTVFSKFTTAIIGPGAPIVLPKTSTQPDYEAELAFVIGKGGRHIQASDWKQHVWGYTMVNDVSARDYQMASTQWLMGKTFDTFAPMGPYLVSADEIEDPHHLSISLRIGDEVLQNSTTDELIFKIPELVAFLSSVFTLETGDVVCTGTPSGVGFARKPPRYLKAGDRVTVAVQGLGELQNPVIAE